VRQQKCVITRMLPRRGSADFLLVQSFTKILQEGDPQLVEAAASIPKGHKTIFPKVPLEWEIISS